ncbi:MAG: hypothetical protein LBU05_03450 [Bifidobacteriaceae bacterium]|jgi:hypothetical protein|nr:hypothetical protein [Bifidobacteriaceae bacterium]
MTTRTQTGVAGGDAADDAGHGPPAAGTARGDGPGGSGSPVADVIAGLDLFSLMPDVTGAMASLAGGPQAAVAAALRPALDAQAAWREQLGGIAPSLPRAAAPSLAGIGGIAARAFADIDFGFAGAAAKTVEAFAARQAELFKAILSIRLPPPSAFYPANLAGIDGLTLERIEQIVMVEGIALHAVPRRSTAEALVRAESAAARRAVLGRRWASISADCRAAAGSWRSAAAAPYKQATFAALDALDAGHPFPAQALAGSLVDTLVTAWFGKQKSKHVPSATTLTSEAYEELTVRQFIAFAPVWRAHLRFYPGAGDPVPRAFNRHATAHTVSRRQFNRRNAVQGLALVCGALSHIDQEAALAEAGPKTTPPGGQRRDGDRSAPPPGGP